MNFLIKPLSQWGKFKCQRGKPIKLSNTHFVFCAQSSRSWLMKLFPWDGKGTEVKFELGRPPILETCVLTCGASKCLEMHVQSIIHPHLSFLIHSHSCWALSCRWSLLSSLLHDFLVDSSFLHAPKFVLGFAEGMGSKDSRFGVFKRPFLSSSCG